MALSLQYPSAMPYRRITQLPDSVRNNLPEHAQRIYKASYNSAEKEYQDAQKRRDGESLEETAHRVAWSAVKRNTRRKTGNG